MNTMDGNKRVVIHGGGMAGAVLAKELSATAQVTLVSPSDFLEVPMAVPRNLVQPQASARSMIAYSQALPGVACVAGRLVEMAPSGGLVVTGAGEHLRLQGDVTVLATGSRYASDLMRGMDGSAAQRQAFYARYSRRIEAARAIVIVGGGPIGIEVAGEIAETYPGRQVAVVEAASRILGGTTPRVAQRAQARLQARGVAVLTGERIVAGASDPADVFATGGQAVTSSGRTLAYDLMIWCVGARPNTEYMQAHYAGCLNEQGRVIVTPQLLVAGQPSMYALGDINDVAENKMAWHVAGQVKTAAHNIRRTLAGERDVARLRRHRAQTGNPSMVVTLGSRGGIACIQGLGVIEADWFVRMVKARDMLVPKYRKVLGADGRG